MKKMIALVDKDNSGTLDYSEFLNLMTRKMVGESQTLVSVLILHLTERGGHQGGYEEGLPTL